MGKDLGMMRNLACVPVARLLFLSSVYAESPASDHITIQIQRKVLKDDLEEINRRLTANINHCHEPYIFRKAQRSDL